jgi:hypothetical protein
MDGRQVSWVPPRMQQASTLPLAEECDFSDATNCVRICSGIQDTTRYIRPRLGLRHPDS